MPTLLSLYKLAKDVSDKLGVYARVFVEWVDNNCQGYENTISTASSAHSRIIECRRV
jgi:hypothetical protein